MNQNTKKNRTINLKLISLFLIIVVAISFILPQGQVFAKKDQRKTYAETISQKEVSLDDDFEDDSVLVVLDERLGGINKLHSLNIFENSNFKSIIDLTKINGAVDEKKYLNRNKFSQILKIQLRNKSKQNVLSAIKILKKIPGVVSAEPNYIYNFSTQENLVATQNNPPALEGTKYESQWGLHGACGSSASLAWNITTGDSRIRVGLIGSGIAEHSCLVGNVVQGWNFLTNEEITFGDVVGFDTQLAGIIGATGATEDGVLGVCRDVSIVPLLVAAPLIGTITAERYIAALNYAINNDIDILQYCAEGSNTALEAEKTALSNYTGLFICPSGGYGGSTNIEDNDIVPKYPANYSSGQEFSNRIITVGAISENGEVASFSNFGKNSVSLFAPGDDIITTYISPDNGVTDGYETMSDTAAAAAHVTGAAALLFSQYINNAHGLSRAEIAAQVKETILANVLKDARYTDKCSSGGRLRTYAALYQMPFRKVMDDFGFKDGSNTFEGKVDLLVGDAKAIDINLNGKLVIEQNTSLTFAVGTITSINYVKIMNGRMTFQLKNSAGEVVKIAGEDTHVSTVRVGLLCNAEHTNPSFTINTASLSDDTYTLNMTSVVSRDGVTQTSSKSYQFIIDRSSCVTEGTMVTLADGQMVAVEDLTGNEQLLVWNFLTGTIDTAPILFIDSDSETTYEIIELSFSDGTIVKVVDEHGFWDINLNKFVYIRSDAMQYIGHWFKKQNINADGGTISTQVQLVGVRIYNETTTTWSPVTFGHLCLYVNGMLSMPGATEGLTNIFAVNPETMKYDEGAMAQDIATYGLFTYEELNAIVPMPEVMFNAVNGQYLKVAIGKGLITINQIEMLVERYSMFF